MTEADMDVIDSGDSSPQDADMERELLQAFLQEFETTTTELERQIIELESSPQNADLTNAIFRSFHNIKGSSSLLGHKILPDLMHYAESLLNLVRQGTASVTEGMITVLLDVLSAMKALAANLQETGKEGEERYFSILDRLVKETISATKQESADGAGPKVEVAKKTNKGDKQDDEGLVKVSKGLVEQIMLTVGNFMTVENRFQYLKNKYSEDFDFVDNCTQLSDQLQKMQQAVLRMQLSSVHTLFTSLHRVVRTTSTETKKKVNFETKGTDTLIDRKILDQLNEPLIHMVRNACDHGIESAEKRAKANKPPEGQVTLEAFYRGGEVFVQLTDDGQGMDPERLKTKAIEKGLITESEAREMGPQEAFQIIFRPGFSSAEKVTNISGRGVGMDVVRQAIDAIGGQITIESNLGSGTTFTLRLPMSLSIVDCLEFLVGGQKYAVQQVNVEEVFSAESQTVREGLRQVNAQSQVLNIRNVPVPILPLAHVFHNQGKKAADELHYILARHGESRFCLAVDHIVGPCSLVTQPLPSVYSTQAPFSGVANRGDGSLLFQLDLGKLADLVTARNGEKRSARRAPGQGTSSDLRRISQKIIVFEAHERLTLPVHAANQIVTARAEELHEVNGRSFFTLDGESIPLLWVEETLMKKPRIQLPQYTIMVYTIDSKTFGMSLGLFKGIHRMPAEFDDTLQSEGVMGSMVFESETYLMLDMHVLTAKAFPHSIRKIAETRSIRRVLLAEDDSFFRGQIVSYLKANDYQVVDFPDGYEAKQALEDPEFVKSIDAIVSDIEMPRMDGIALLRHLKNNEATRHLPVVMLSAITTREVVTKVLKLGAHAYVTKMHNSQVIQELKKIDTSRSNLSQKMTPTEYATDRDTSSALRSERIVTFSLADNLFALPMNTIKEVSKRSKSARIGGFPEWMHHVTSFRGKFIPVVRLRTLFQLGGDEQPVATAERQPSTRHLREDNNQSTGEQIIMEVDGTYLCIEVDGLGEVLLLSQLKHGAGLPSLSQFEKHISQFVDGVYKRDSDLICLVQAKALETFCSQRIGELPPDLRGQLAGHAA
jgi:two-component system chemotaxis sensor kinase CheA